LPNVGPYIYDVSISGFTRSSIYIYDISSLRVKCVNDFYAGGKMCHSTVGIIFRVTSFDCFRPSCCGRVKCHTESNSKTVHMFWSRTGF